MAAKRLKWSFRGMDARGTGVEYVRAGEYDAACVEREQARMEAAEWRRKHDALEQQLGVMRASKAKGIKGKATTDEGDET